jgi:flagellar motor switch protein FliG
MAASRFVEDTDKVISEIKINSVPKTQKTCVKILKQLFASGSVIIAEYSP